MTSVAARLTTKFGNDAVFYRPDPTYDPATGITTYGTPATTAIPVAGPFGYDERMIDGLTILELDQYLVVAADLLGFVPVPGLTTVTVVGHSYAITSVIPYSSEDTDLAYEVQIR